MMTVPLSQNAELIYIVAPDGEIFEFAKDNFLDSLANFGTPGYNFITSKAYKQDGSSFVGEFAEERLITIEYKEGPFDDRQAWWDRRLELQRFFRPNRGGLFTFVVQQPEHTYSIRVIPDPGMEFGSGDITDQVIEERINLRAFDPFWSEEDVDAATFESVTATQLVFPITFPITFGESGSTFSTGVLDYPGTAKVYPVITLTGPYTVATLTIFPQNKRIRLIVEVPDGIRIIDPNPSNPSIVDGNGNSCFNELDISSDPLQDFAIQPEPPASGQYVTVNFLGATPGLTNATIQYQTKYIGI